VGFGRRYRTAAAKVFASKIICKRGVVFQIISGKLKNLGMLGCGPNGGRFNGSTGGKK